jgi:hypothetical protein
MVSLSAVPVTTVEVCVTPLLTTHLTGGAGAAEAAELKSAPGATTTIPARIPLRIRW